MQGALKPRKEHKNHTKTTPHIYEMPQNKTTPILLFSSYDII